MIPRTLVPKGARPPADVQSTRRRPSTLDERTLVPSTLPIVPLDGHSTIPANLPLEAIATRMVVPRDINVELVQRPEETTLPPQPTEMDERITIPHGVAPPDELPEILLVPDDLVEPDIIKTGEVSFLPPERPNGTAGKDLATRIVSIAFHIFLVLFLIFEPKIFPHQRSQEEEELGRKQISVLLPPGALESLKPSPPPAPKPLVKVDPRELRRMAPPAVQPPPAPVAKPEPVQPKRELPSSPVPQPNAVQPKPQPEEGSRGELPKTPQKLETPDMPVPQQGLTLPKQLSPGDSIRDATRSLGKLNSPVPMGGGGQLPGGVGGGRGGHGGTAGAGVEILSDTEGVDFNDYLRRVYITVKQNWYAVMPASVSLGDQGVVSLQFKINRDGTISAGDPQRVFGSGKEPLDRAAISSIRASNPFPQLPPQFHGPFIELRFTYYYNLPIPTAGHQ